MNKKNKLIKINKIKMKKYKMKKKNICHKEQINIKITKNKLK
jgi:hypothetical protein